MVASCSRISGPLSQPWRVASAQHVDIVHKYQASHAIIYTIELQSGVIKGKESWITKITHNEIEPFKKLLDTYDGEHTRGRASEQKEAGSEGLPSKRYWEVIRG